jgi:CRISPR type I-E-associated protein CasA/Cse1
VTPELTGKLHAFFGMPRRIRLAFDDDCRASAYRTVGYGMNYSGWFGRHAHPLSPYYKDAKANTLPVHPRAGPTSYRDWLGILVNRDEAFRASCVNTAARRIAALGVRRNNLRPDILAFGYDQDNAKARGFSVQSVPWILAAQEKAFSDLMAVAVEASEASAKAVRYAVQMARHGEVAISDTGSASISVRDEGKKSGENVYHAFYAVSEPDFRNYLDAIAPLEFFEDSLEARGEFAKACRRIARQLFAEHVDMDGRDMRRTVLAEKWLGVALNSTKAKSYVFKSLQLEVQEARHV